MPLRERDIYISPASFQVLLRIRTEASCHLSPMEKLLKPYDKEFMKMAILKHEETFKQQVSELHRLYQIQKALMRGLRTKPRLDQINGNNPLQGFLDSEKPITEDSLELEMEEESDIELTLGPSNFYKSTKRAERRTRTSESGPSFSSSTSSGSSQSKRKTISTRMNERTIDEISFDVEKELNQSKLKPHPHWLYQTLSLNMT